VQQFAGRQDDATGAVELDLRQPRLAEGVEFGGDRGRGAGEDAVEVVREALRLGQPLVAALRAAVVVGVPRCATVEGGDERLRGQRREMVGPAREVDAQRVVGAEIAVGAAAGDVALIVGGGREGAVGQRSAADRGGRVDREGTAQSTAPVCR
jgi:hypothetical protein